ncbi:hypothetical protein PCE1_001443 [Barthelona sp. PCE]
MHPSEDNGEGQFRDEAKAIMDEYRELSNLDNKQLTRDYVVPIVLPRDYDPRINMQERQKRIKRKKQRKPKKQPKKTIHMNKIENRVERDIQLKIGSKPRFSKIVSPKAPDIVDINVFSAPKSVSLDTINRERRIKDGIRKLKKRRNYRMLVNVFLDWKYYVMRLNQENALVRNFQIWRVMSRLRLRLKIIRMNNAIAKLKTRIDIDTDTDNRTMRRAGVYYRTKLCKNVFKAWYKQTQLSLEEEEIEKKERERKDAFSKLLGRLTKPKPVEEPEPESEPEPEPRPRPQLPPTPQAVVNMEHRAREIQRKKEQRRKMQIMRERENREMLMMYQMEKLSKKINDSLNKKEEKNRRHRIKEFRRDQARKARRFRGCNLMRLVICGFDRYRTHLRHAERTIAARHDRSLVLQSLISFHDNVQRQRKRKESNANKFYLRKLLRKGFLGFLTFHELCRLDMIEAEKAKKKKLKTLCFTKWRQAFCERAKSTREGQLALLRFDEKLLKKKYFESFRESVRHAKFNREQESRLSDFSDFASSLLRKYRSRD